MNLFGFGKQPDDPVKQARDEARAHASQILISEGGLPLNATERLTEQKQRRQDGKPFFTSDLSPSEFLLTHQCGFEPLGQVMGSCVYHVGWQYLPQNTWLQTSGEMWTLTESQVNARHLAFSRLLQEAKLLGADGVVGVRFTRSQSNFGAQEIEFMAIGTAVRRKDAPPLVPGVEPFVSNLSGQDHWQLRQAGMAPLGFVFGSCAWYQYPDWRSQSAMLTFYNAELTSLSQGVYTAREIALDRLELEAGHLRAAGVVGTTFESYTEVLPGGDNQPGGFLMHCTVFGTAVGVDEYAYTHPTSKLNILPIVSLGNTIIGNQP